MQSAELEGLIARVEALSRPDLRVDRLVKRLDPYWGARVGTPAYTASLDAAVALAERAFPGIWWHLAKGRMTADEPLYAAQLLFGADEIVGEGEGPTPTIALCLAILNALRSRQEGNGNG